MLNLSYPLQSLAENEITSEKDRIEVASDLVSLTYLANDATSSDVQDAINVIEKVITQNTSQEVRIQSRCGLQRTSVLLTNYYIFTIEPGWHEPQLPVERSVTLVSSIVVEPHRCALKVSSVARLQDDKET